MFSLRQVPLFAPFARSRRVTLLSPRNLNVKIRLLPKQIAGGEGGQGRQQKNRTEQRKGQEGVRKSGGQTLWLHTGATTGSVLRSCAVCGRQQELKMGGEDKSVSEREKDRGCGCICCGWEAEESESESESDSESESESARATARARWRVSEHERERE